MHLLAASSARYLSLTFIGLLLLLHGVRADLAPSWHMISEYAVGRAGWLMTSAFYALAGALFSLMLALVPLARGWLGRLGLLLLVVASVGAAMGGLFTTDPPGTPREHVSSTGMLHGFSFMLGVPGTVLAATLINARLWRDARFRSARPLLLGTAAFVWVTLIVFAVSMAFFLGRGAVGPAFLVGFQNRALVLAWALWIYGLSSRIVADFGPARAQRAAV